VMCVVKEATSRGAAMLALERLGVIGSINDLPPQFGDTVQPDRAKKEVYGAALAKQRQLYKELFEEQK